VRCRSCSGCATSGVRRRRCAARADRGDRAPRRAAVQPDCRCSVDTTTSNASLRAAHARRRSCAHAREQAARSRCERAAAFGERVAEAVGRALERSVAHTELLPCVSRVDRPRSSADRSATVSRRL
jgi:hypothetical protein